MKARLFTLLSLISAMSLLAPGEARFSVVQAQGSFSCATVTQIP